MQTFMTYPYFELTARSLDTKRLGKQRVEALQILNALTKDTSSGWSTHPATLMWLGYEKALKAYHDAMIKEWVRRGYNNTMELFGIEQEETFCPKWVTDKRVHLSHQANLVRKEHEFYAEQFPDALPYLEYFWPVSRKEGLLSYEKCYSDLTEDEALRDLKERSKGKMFFIVNLDESRSIEAESRELMVFNEDPTEHIKEKFPESKAEIVSVKTPQDLLFLTGPQMVGLYNEASTTPVSKFSDKETAAKRTFLALGALAEEVPKKRRAANNNGSVKFTGMLKDIHDKKIIVNVLENPKRKGSNAYEYYEILKQFDGSTVQEFIEQGEKKAKGYNGKPWASHEVKYCLQRGFIGVK